MILSNSDLLLKIYITKSAKEWALVIIYKVNFLNLIYVEILYVYCHE